MYDGFGIASNRRAICTICLRQLLNNVIIGEVDDEALYEFRIMMWYLKSFRRFDIVSVILAAAAAVILLCLRNYTTSANKV